jgi:hypothetical protein
MLVLGFTDEQLDDLYDAERWSVDEQQEIIIDTARPGGFDRIYAAYLRAGRTPDRVRYMIYLADGARQYDMIEEALAILRQATRGELEEMRYRAEPPLRELISQVQREKSGGRLKLAVGLSFVAALAGGVSYWYFRKPRSNGLPPAAF